MSLDPHSARLLPSVVTPPTVAFHPVDAPTPDPLRDMKCPNCGSAAAKTLVLTVDVQLPDNPAKRLRVLRCPGCTASFYDSQVPPDYAEPALNNRGRVPFYVQQGAGVSLITRPLAQLRRPAGTSYMEVGCGYGFGLDFALNTRGWTGLGIDPAPLAELGRDALHLPIELRYLRDDDEARGTIDVVLGSEVIEHVTSPAAFVRTLRAMLKPGGVLVLTTPNGDDIDPKTPPGILIPLLSPSLHLVIQNRSSLEALLRRSGFEHVAVGIDSHSLVAFASDVPLDLEEDGAALRRTFRDHLRARAGTVDPASDLFVAFAGRAFCESVNDGAMEDADHAWALLVPAVRNRYGLDLETLDALPPAVATGSLEEMARLVPLNLGGMLYAGAIRRLAAGTPRRELGPTFLLASSAAGSMRRALGELAMEDGQTEDIGWTALAEAALCAADARADDLVSRLRDLPPAPNGGERRRLSIRLRAVTGLVNAGALDAGQQVADAFDLASADFVRAGSDRTEAEHDALFSLAVLAIQPGIRGDLVAARARFGEVRRGCEAGGPLWWSALRGELQAALAQDDADGAAALAVSVERDHPAAASAPWALIVLVNLGRYDTARGLAARNGLNRAAWAEAGDAPLTTEQRDAVFALAVLDAEVGPDGQPRGDLALARERFRRVRRASDPGSALWWAALRGETQVLAQRVDLEGIAELVGAIGRKHGRIDTAAWRFSGLMQARRFEEARELGERENLAAFAEAQPEGGTLKDETRRQVLLGLAQLDGRERSEDLLRRAIRRFSQAGTGTVPGSPSWWAALRGEADARGRLGDRDGVASLAAQVGQEHPDVETGRWALPNLVNAGRYAEARRVALASGLAEAAFSQPDSTRPLSAEERDLVFHLAVLDAEIGADGRAAGEPAMARGRFARVRRAADEGSELWVAALRGELQALDLLDAHEDAAALTRDVRAAYPNVALPADVLARIGEG